MMGRLIREHIVAALGNPRLNTLLDSAVLDWSGGPVVFTTDSYVVQPLFFPGGDIGRLAVCGTCNDLAVMGATPVALSLGIIVEEGLELSVFDRVLASVAAAADEAGVSVVTGDTKVIERGRGDGLYLNTAGVGSIHSGANTDPKRIAAGDAILVNGTIGDHGIAVMSARNDLEFETPVVSDAAPLNGMIAVLLDAGVKIRFMRDATRGGLAGVLVDITEQSGLSVEIEEHLLPRRPATLAAAEMLGFDLLSVANEGKVVIVVAAEDAERCLKLLRGHAHGKDAARIGRLADTQPALVELITAGGGRRVVQRPYGEELPRIC